MAENRDKDASEEERGFTISDHRHWAKEKVPGEPSKAGGEAPPPSPTEAEIPPRAEEVSGEAAAPPKDSQSSDAIRGTSDCSYW